MAAINAAFDAALATSRAATSSSVTVAEAEDDGGRRLDGGTKPTMAGSSSVIDIIDGVMAGRRW